MATQTTEESVMSIGLRVVGVLGAGLLLATTVTGCLGEDSLQTDAPLKLGLLLDFPMSPEVSADRQRGFELAIKQVNDAGGVLGRPVEFATGDAPRDVSVSMKSARRLVDEGVHAIVGPSSSASSLPIAEEVTGPAGIPTISPSATSPQLTDAEDGDFFFRTTLSDTAQGPVLARVTKERGFSNVGLIYRDDPYGQGLAATFESAWGGTIVSVAVDSGQASFLPAIRETKSAGAEALVVINFVLDVQTIVREALDAGLYDQFVFGDAAKRPSLIEEIGSEHLGGMHGTAGVPAPAGAAGAAWDAAFVAEYGQMSAFPYVKEAYDAAMTIMLAAEAAGSVDGHAIRDQLRAIARPPGQTVHATPDGIADALRLLREGKEIDYEGAASTLDWDANGDLRRGHIGVWRFTKDGGIEEVEVIPVEP